MTTSAAAPQNRLARATSPYLLQHAHNPVDWHEWGPEALELARRENKPIFLSIGYAACHWCHVMAHESFEDPEIAAVMNRLFVNIKVDREERPDLDAIYMQATMIINQGQGGWPMSVWLTPDLKPFYAGTYFPPKSCWGRPGFVELCERIGELWKESRNDIVRDAETLTAAVAQQLAAQPDADARFSIVVIDKAAAVLAGAFDPDEGGMLSGGTNKFPPSMTMDLMLRSALRRGLDADESRRLVALVELTLDKMARGGITDHLAGGICRYSTDARWLVPHFEKMLYDQALVSRIYLDAFLATGARRHADAARGIFDYVLADLRSPQGGLYSSRDADSEGEEGRYYVWTRAQVLDALGAAEGELFCSYYDVSEAGNWSDAHAPGVAKNILHAPRDPETAARLSGIEPQELDRRLALGRRKLLAARSQRVAPGLDDKVLVEWNGLMIASLARGGAALEEPRYIAAAARAADFLLANQLKDGRLKRAWRDGRTLDAAFLSDYACLIEGLIELYDATFERRWFDTAIELTHVTIERFWDERGGGFFFTANDHESLIARTKDVRDSAVPSGNSVMLKNLLRLGVMTGDAELRAKADAMMHALAGDVLGQIGAAEMFLQGVEFALAGPVELAVVGDPSDAATTALLGEIRRSYLPNRVLMLLNPAQPGSSPESPLLKQRTLVHGRPAVYVCRNYACGLPATSAEQLRSQLAPSAP